MSDLFYAAACQTDFPSAADRDEIGARVSAKPDPAAPCDRIGINQRWFRGAARRSPGPGDRARRQRSEIVT
jgi:hypothetical protein